MERQELSALRWGGIAGLLGGVMMPAVFVFLAVVGGMETLGPQAAIERFPDLRPARIVENTAYLLTLALWALHSVALVLALRGEALGPALAGGVMSCLGLAILATGAVPHVATTPISDLYHAPDRAVGLEAPLIVAWQAIQGWVDAMVVTGLVLAPIGMVLFGVAMRRHPDLDGWPAWLSMALGLAGLVSAAMGLVEAGDILAIGIFALVFFHLIIGWRTFRLASG